jgi:hypothetical protein
MNDSEIHDRLHAIERRLTTLEITLWGRDGDNGLKAAINDLRHKMDMLLRFFWVATAVPAVAVAVIAILKFMGKIG